MLSVCIPVFNYNVLPLINEVLRQANSVDKDVEILVYDTSEDQYLAQNQAIGQLPLTRYVRHSCTVSREALRNVMAREAAGEYLLMLDDDCWPDTNFLANYVQRLPAVVMVGGTRYADKRPQDPELFLHWHYGRRREASAPARRRNRFFQSNNFVVRKDILLAHPFPESEALGHSDTLWGQLLVPANITIQYVDNPVIHLGLMKNRDFLAKQKREVESLRLLRKQYPTVRTRLTTFADRYPKVSSLSEFMPEEALSRYVLERGNLKALDILKLKWWVSGWVPAIGYL
ncbi:glycosyltransferase family 2 protein [Lewinella sp. IMCC34191]|uniref:glycosyltransferase family 2 protein n=1 Tax=Lewinella sp. IMCC34191 TaxID=2259172 RepID=UPI000E283441|nr:glycosyltransferase [Lewinella sp. IMCC34191]